MKKFKAVILALIMATSFLPSRVVLAKGGATETPTTAITFAPAITDDSGDGYPLVAYEIPSSESNDGIVRIRMKSKKKSTGSTLYYATVGYTVSLINSGSGDPTAKKGYSMTVPVYENDENYKGTVASQLSKFDTNKFKVIEITRYLNDKPSTNNKLKESFEYYREYTHNGVTYRLDVIAIPKVSIVRTLCETNPDLDISKYVNSKGEVDLYISPIIQVCNNGKWSELLYSIDDMYGHGIDSLVDNYISPLFNLSVPCRVQYGNSRVSYDTQGNRLEFEELSNACSAHFKKEYTKQLSNNQTAQYDLLYTLAVPYLAFPESNTISVLGTRIRNWYSSGNQVPFDNAVSVKQAVSSYFGWYKDEFDKYNYNLKSTTMAKPDVYAGDTVIRKNVLGNAVGTVYCGVYKERVASLSSIPCVFYDKTTGLSEGEGTIQLVNGKAVTTGLNLSKYVLEDEFTVRETTIEKDKADTLRHFKTYHTIHDNAGKPLSLTSLTSFDGIPATGVARMIVTKQATIPVVYYNENTKQIVKIDNSFKVDPTEVMNTSYNVPISSQFEIDGKKYTYTKATVIKDVTIEDDYQKTLGNKIFSSSDSVITSNMITVERGTTPFDKIFIKASCKEETEAVAGVSANIMIPSNYLTKTYTLNDMGTVSADFSLPNSTTSTCCTWYETATSGVKHGSGATGTTVTHKVSADKTISYDWADPPSYNYAFDSSLNAFNAGAREPYKKYLVGNLGSANYSHWLTKPSQSGKENDTVAPKLQVVSSMYGITGTFPTFYKFKADDNKSIINYLNNGNMSNAGDLVKSGIVPSNYSKAKSGTASVSITHNSLASSSAKAIKTIDYCYYCGTEDKVSPYTVVANSYTGLNYTYTIGTNGLYTAPSLPVGGSIEDVVTSSSSVTYRVSGSPIDFYPYYKMFAETPTGVLNAFVVGNTKRSLVPVDEYTISINSVPTTMSAAWARDKNLEPSANGGLPTLKGGYAFTVNTEGIKITIKSKIVVPKSGYTSMTDTARQARLDNHKNFVNSIKSNMVDYVRVFSNLPESYDPVHGDPSWRIPYPASMRSEDVEVAQKSKLQTKATLTGESTTSSTGTALSALTSQRLKDQLYSQDWYVERFDGFEEVTQETSITLTVQSNHAINFVRNGDRVKNKLAPNHTVGNIPAGVFGVSIGVGNRNQFNLEGHNIAGHILYLKPALFNVQGTLYDDARY